MRTAGICRNRFGKRWLTSSCGSLRTAAAASARTGQSRCRGRTRWDSSTDLITGRQERTPLGHRWPLRPWPSLVSPPPRFRPRTALWQRPTTERLSQPQMAALSARCPSFLELRPRPGLGRSGRRARCRLWARRLESLACLRSRQRAERTGTQPWLVGHGQSSSSEPSSAGALGSTEASSSGARRFPAA